MRGGKCRHWLDGGRHNEKLAATKSAAGHTDAFSSTLTRVKCYSNYVLERANQCDYSRDTFTGSGIPLPRLQRLVSRDPGIVILSV